MKATVGVVIGTYGDETYWAEWASSAYESVAEQTVTPDCIRWRHDSTLANARNNAAKQIETDYLIFLDADDTLDPGYVQAMLAVDGDIRQPSTLGIQNGVADDYPVLIPETNLRRANYIVVGAMVKRSLFFEVGGFAELPCLEDWDLFLRMWLAGAKITAAPDAIYRVTVRESSRNQDQALHGRVYSDIIRRYQNVQRSSTLEE